LSTGSRTSQDRAPGPGTTGSPDAVVAWLAAVATRTDLSLPPPADENAVALTLLLETISQEFADYRAVVAGAREAARRNTSGLLTVLRSTGATGALVRATAGAAAEAGTGGALMAGSAEALAGFTRAAAGAADDAAASLAAIAGTLEGLGLSLAACFAPLAEMRALTGGVAGFLVTLARLSRHAQLLAVNASIEAAHLAEEGSRFAIVADEVRKLSVSTRESKAGVAQIVADLRASTDHVSLAAAESQIVAAEAGTEIGGSGDALARTARGIGEFEHMTATLADVAATQQMALEAIGSALAGLAHHADEAANASPDAARLDLDTLLVRAPGQTDRWKLRPHSAPRPPGETDFSRWMGAVAGGADPALVTAIEADDEFRPLVTAVRGLLARINAEQRAVLANLVEVAVAVSHNGYAWVTVGGSLGAMQREIDTIHETAVQATEAAQTSAGVAARMQTLVETMRNRYSAALMLLEGALTRIARISGSVGEIDGFVESMNGAADRADHIMALIETLSSQTDLLSINAAIEAAHAGELGQGFSVIAEEIGALARTTNDSTISVSQLVSNISGISGKLQSAIAAAAAGMTDVGDRAAAVRTALAVLHDSFESAMQRAHEVFASAAEQTRGLDCVLDNINRSRSALAASAPGTTDQPRLELAMLGSQAHAVAARRPIGTVVARVRELAESLCTSGSGARGRREQRSREAGRTLQLGLRTR
jgi:methyl-accepting chemotaxis protein